MSNLPERSGAKPLASHSKDLSHIFLEISRSHDRGQPRDIREREIAIRRFRRS